MSSFVSPALLELGLTPFFHRQFQELVLDAASQSESLQLARIVCEHRGEFEAATGDGTFRVSLSGRLERLLGDRERPCVGDWVAIEPADPVGRVHHLLERQTALRRAEASRTSRAQVLAANVDLCSIVCALTDSDATEHTARRALNPRRIERYLQMAAQSQVPALVVINKADLLPEERAKERAERLCEALPTARTVLVSALNGLGIAELERELEAGRSAVLLGSSGVGKSTLVNALLGQTTRKVRAERHEDARGRHTTTERHLTRLRNGALLIDTPGMRELALWADADSDETHADFEDIDHFAEGCRFRDCRHQGEPGCAVALAIERGELSAARLQHALELERELLHQRRRTDARLRAAEQKRWKTIARAIRATKLRH